MPRGLTKREAKHNQGLRPDNTSGYNGISLQKAIPMWIITWREPGNRKQHVKQWKRTLDNDEPPAECMAFIAALNQHGGYPTLKPRKFMTVARYVVKWTELGDRKQQIKTFPATEEGLVYAIQLRDQMYARIGNNNHKNED